MFYIYSVKISKCRGSCTNINDPYAKLCVSNVVKNINVKVFNLMSRTNRTRYITWHKTCIRKYRLDPSVCNNKQKQNKDKFRHKRKKLIEKRICNNGFIWNPSNCDCEYDKLCDIGEYLDYRNCKCIKVLINKLFEECIENINGSEMIYNGTLNNYKNVCSSCTIYIVLLVIFLISSRGISNVFIYFYWFLKKGNTDVININPVIDTTIY